MSAYQHLTVKQREFVDLLVRRVNATEAVRQMKGVRGRPYERPDVQAAKWRALPVVQEALAEREAEAMLDAGITNAQVLLDIAFIGNISIKDFHNEDGSPKALHELSDEAARVVEGVEFKDGKVHRYRLPSRLEAKKLLGSHLKLFIDRREISGPDGGPVGVVDMTPNDLGRRIYNAMVAPLQAGQKSQGSADRAQTQAAGSPSQALSTDHDEE